MFHLLDTDEATSVKACSVSCPKPLLIQKKWVEGSGGPAQSCLGSWDTYELRLKELAFLVYSNRKAAKEAPKKSPQLRKKSATEMTEPNTSLQCW